MTYLVWFFITDLLPYVFYFLFLFYILYPANANNGIIMRGKIPFSKKKRIRKGCANQFSGMERLKEYNQILSHIIRHKYKEVYFGEQREVSETP